MKAAKAPNFTGVPPLSDLAFDNDESTGLDPPGVDASVSSGAGESSGRQHDVVPEEDVLVSVKDLAPVNKKKKKQSKPESTTRQPSPAKPAAHTSSSRSPSSSPHSRSLKQASPEQFVTSGPTFSSDCYRRQSSNASHGSISQTSALAASDSPRDASSSKAFSREPAQMNVQQVTETINNPTWGMGEWGSTTRSWTMPRGPTSTDASASSDLLGLALYLDGTTNLLQQSSLNRVWIMPEYRKKRITPGTLNRLIRLACMISISINDSRRSSNNNARLISLVSIRKRCCDTMPKHLSTRWRMDDVPRSMIRAECRILKRKLDLFNSINRWSADLLMTT